MRSRYGIEFCKIPMQKGSKLDYNTNGVLEEDLLAVIIFRIKKTE